MPERETVQDFAAGPPYAPQWERPRMSLGRAHHILTVVFLILIAIIAGFGLRYGASFLPPRSVESARSIAVPADQTHHPPHLVERWILQPFVTLQGPQPLLDFQRCNAQRSPFSPLI